MLIIFMMGKSDFKKKHFKAKIINQQLHSTISNSIIYKS